MLQLTLHMQLSPQFSPQFCVLFPVPIPPSSSSPSTVQSTPATHGVALMHGSICPASPAAPAAAAEPNSPGSPALPQPSSPIPRLWPLWPLLRLWPLAPMATEGHSCDCGHYPYGQAYRADVTSSTSRIAAPRAIAPAFVTSSISGSSPAFTRRPTTAGASSSGRSLMEHTRSTACCPSRRPACLPHSVLDVQTRRTRALRSSLRWRATSSRGRSL